MSLFAIADLHLSLGCDKPMDVFEGWEHYTERLEQNWRALVKPEDTVVIAGDVSWAMKLEETEQDFRFLHSLPGRKLIIKGNHDYWWTTKKKMNDYVLSHGFDTLRFLNNDAAAVEEIGVCGTRGWLCRAETAQDKKLVNREACRLDASIADAVRQGLRPIVFLHYPPFYDGFACEEILTVLAQRGIRQCYFGHIHGSQAARRAVSGEYRGIVMHLVSCDHVRFTPVLVR